MEAYTVFSDVYDTFMDNVPYEKWCERIDKCLKENKIEGRVVDLGCGSGTMTELMAKKGYEMLGIDSSDEMLMRAYDKKIDSGLDIMYINQDFTRLDLPYEADAFICVCDCLNYVLEKEKLLKVFKGVSKFLKKDGMFLFDINTVCKFESILADNVFAESRENESFIWENSYDSEARINEYDLTLFIREEDDLFRKYSEVHYQRAYTFEEIDELLKNTGFEVLSFSDEGEKAFYAVKKL